MSKIVATEGKHTPGPWYRDFGGGYGEGHIYSDHFPKNCIGGKEAFAVCHLPGLTDSKGLTKEAFDMMEANAQLMAAAPDLLEVLREVIDGTAFYQARFSSKEWRAKARAALAKAGS